MMKKVLAIVAACVGVYLLYQGYVTPGITLARFGYIGAGVILFIGAFVPFLPKLSDEERTRKF